MTFLKAGCSCLGTAPSIAASLLSVLSFCTHTLLVCVLDSICHMLQCMHCSGYTSCSFATWSQHATSETIFDCLVTLSAAFAACSLTEKPHDCIENLVCFLVWTSYIPIPGHTAPVPGGLHIPEKCTSHKLVPLPLCCLYTVIMASI